MDNQNQNSQNPIVPLPQLPVSQPETTNPAVAPSQIPKKVIQPSQELVKEIADNPSSYYSRDPSINAPVTKTQPSNSTTGQSQSSSTTYNPRSIYPEATNGVSSEHINNSNNVDNPPRKSINDTLTKLISIGIIALGIYIALPALLSLVGWATIISYGGINSLSKAGTPIYIIDVIYLIVGVGIILRKELARLAFVIIGVILLFIGVLGTINYFRQNHTVSPLAAYYAE